MKTVRTRVKSAFRRNSKGVVVLPDTVPAKLPGASSSAPSLLSKTDDGTSAPPVSPVTPLENGLALPFHVGPQVESPITEKQAEDLPLAELKFTGYEPERVYIPPPSTPITNNNSKGATPKKRVKSVPRVSSDSKFPSPSIASRIQTTLPPPKDDDEETKFVSPIDPNYLIDDKRGSEPRILDQPPPTDPAFVEFTPKDIPSSLPPLHEILAHQAYLKRLDSSIEVARAASVHETINEDKPLLDSSLLSAEVDDILDSVWPLASPSFPSLGWAEHVLPSSAYYYSHAATRTVTDIDLRNEKKLAAVRSYLKSRRSTPDAGSSDNPFVDGVRGGDSTPTVVEDGVDLWLRDANAGFGTKDTAEWHFMPIRSWVLHATRAVTFEPPSERDGYRTTDDLSDEDRLDLENRYWQYMATHPAHAALPQTAYEEAVEVVMWCYTDRVLRTPQPLSAAPPFTRRECVELLDLLRNLTAPTPSASSSAARTRVVAQILLRYTEWRQKYVVRLNDKHSPPSKDGEDNVEFAIPYRSTLLHFIKGFLCLGIPFLYESRRLEEVGSSIRQTDEEAQREAGFSRADDVWLGSGQFVVAALLLSASVTFLALPELHGVSRVAALISALCSSASMASYVFTIHARFHGRNNRPKSGILPALPLVMLAYSLCALVAGIIAYSLSGAVAPSRVGRWVVVGVSITLGVVLAASAAVLRK